MPAWRQTEVGPSAMNIAATAVTAIALGTTLRIKIAVTARRTTTSFHVPDTLRSGRSPNPPASEPAMAPAVFHAYVRPTCEPTASRPSPRSEMSSGN